MFAARTEDCRGCKARQSCCPENNLRNQGRSVGIAVRAPAIDRFHRKMETSAAKAIYRKRSQLAEFPNLWWKEKLKFRRFSLRGRIKARTQALLNTLTFDIQRLLRIRPALAM